MRQYSNGDPLRVHVDAHGCPVAFNWHGGTYRVATVEDVRETRLDWWSSNGEVRRRYYVVTTQQELICEIYQDLTTGQWFVGRLYD